MIFIFSTLFLVLVVALLVERFFNCSQLRSWNWVLKYHDLIDKRFGGKNSVVIVLIMLVPVALLISIIEFNLRLWFYGVLGIVFEFLVLLYCIGPRSAFQDIETLKNLSPNQESDINALLDVEVTSVREGTWLMFARRILSPVCWFVLLGAGGVFFYRFLEVTARLLSKKSETLVFANRAKRLLDGFDWMPVRLFSLIFALAGHFAFVMVEWKKRVWSAPFDNQSMLSACGNAGLHLSESAVPLENAIFLNDASLLIERSMIIFMGILALLVLILW